MTALFEEELGVEDSKTKKETVLEFLKERNLLKYGELIAPEIIIELYEIEGGMRNIKEWNLSVLNLMNIISSEGFFTTSRGRNNSLYILKAHEMAEYNNKKNRNAYENLKSRQRCLYMIDDSLFDEEAKKKLEFEKLRNGHLTLTMAEKLKERCR